MLTSGVFICLELALPKRRTPPLGKHTRLPLCKASQPAGIYLNSKTGLGPGRVRGSLEQDPKPICPLTSGASTDQPSSSTWVAPTWQAVLRGTDGAEEREAASSEQPC